jgi:hypothetical protein
MAAEGIPVGVACRVLDVVGVGLLRLAVAAAVDTGDPPRLAH